MPTSPRGPSGLLRRWESLPAAVQAAISFPLFAVVLLVLNLGLFNQPLLRSLVYCVIEAVPFTVLLLVATANERSKHERAAGKDRTEA